MWMQGVIWLSLCEEMATEGQRRIVDYQMLLRAKTKNISFLKSIITNFMKNHDKQNKKYHTLIKRFNTIV